MRYIFLTFWLLASGLLAQSQPFEEPLSQRVANYDIDVALDTEARKLKGEMTLHWKNLSPDTLYELQFHLYLNAFKNTGSTFLKNRASRVAGYTEQQWGWVDVENMKIRGGETLTRKIAYIQPDDDNPNDQTVLSVPLNQPILPGDTVHIDIEFVSKLPKIIARTGYSRDFYMIAQWFPKIGVYEAKGDRYAQQGGWNCHQFHATSEFFADFGLYNVNITLPQTYKVGASGVLKKEKQNADGTKTLSFQARDVIDFAWTASPRFRVLEKDWKHVKIKLLIQPEHKRQAERHFQSAVAALEYFENTVGKYPYKTLTIVDPPFHGLAAGGMEYPTLITAGTAYMLPKGMRAVENVVIHEFGHQYFMGIIASNETEEAWLDEGINTYMETRIMDDVYGKKTSLIDIWGIQIGDGESKRSSYTGMWNPKIAEIYRPSWEYPHGGYGAMSYSKPATMLMTLEKIVGRDAMNRILQTYYHRWKFKHPSTLDFIAIVNEITAEYHGKAFGDNMNWFFNQLLYGNNVCDYQLAAIRNKTIKKPVGVIDAANKRIVNTQAYEAENKMYRSSVIIYRKGEVIMPVEVLVRFASGEEKLVSYHGKARSHEFTFETPDRIVFAKVDPENKLMIDINQNNNSRALSKKSSPLWKYWAKFLFALQNIMQFFAVLA